MKKYIKYVYAAIVVFVTCYVCAVVIPSMNLTKKIRVSDEVDIEQDFLDVQPGEVLRQPFVTRYEDVHSLRVYIDSFLLDKEFQNLIVSVVDEEENVLYTRTIHGSDLKTYGWQEVVSDIVLETDTVYFLELKHEALTEGNQRFAVTDNGRACFEIVYKEALEQEKYAPYYWFVVLVAVIMLTHIFIKK